jgi:hypothetical protein
MILAKIDLDKFNKNRFDGRFSDELGDAVVQIGQEMQRYLGARLARGWTPGEFLDVLCNLGYTCEVSKRHGVVRPKEEDFRKNVRRFARAMAEFKQRQRRAFPALSEGLAVATALGWRRRRLKDIRKTL